MNFKFNIGEEVEIRMTFAQPTLGIGLDSIKATISKREINKGSIRYKLKGLTGWFQETTLFKIGG